MKHYEETVASTEIYKGKVVHLFSDKVKLEDGRNTIRDVIRHSGGVCVAALDEDMNLLMVSQYRYPIGKELLELPAGKLEPGETPENCGFRELEEETGYTSNSLKSLGELYPTPAYTDEIIYIFYTNKTIRTSQHLDEGEFLTLKKIPFWSAYDMVISGEIQDAKTQIAILKLSEVLRDNSYGE